MATLFPGALDTFSAPPSTLDGPPTHAFMHQALSDALTAIELELGINPSGTDATITARLARIEATVTANAASAAAVSSATTAAIAAAQAAAQAAATASANATMTAAVATVQGAANAAQGTANTAQGAANTAQGSANTGIANAATAQSAANAAQGTANAAVRRSGDTMTGSLNVDGNVQAVNLSALTGDVNAVNIISRGSGRFLTDMGGFNGARINTNSNNALHFNWTGTELQMFIDGAAVKTFVIPHPTKPDRFLVHAVAEGATADVFYRGRGQLVDGTAVVELPDYFEALTESEGRTVIVQPIADEGANVAGLAVTEPVDGQFTVSGSIVLDQAFYWRVDAIRKATAFDAEPPADAARLHGDGPYTWLDNGGN